jgi:hypothetical protein
MSVSYTSDVFSTYSTIRELTAEELDWISGGKYSWGGFGGAVGRGIVAGGVSGAAVGWVFGPGVWAGAGAGALGGGIYNAVDYLIDNYD